MMTKLKASKVLLVLFSLILSFSLFACSETNYPKAEESVKGFFDALSKSDFKTAQTYCSLSSSDEFNFSDEKEEKVAKLMYSKIKYEIISSKEEDNKTIVKVKFTNIDMSKVFDSMMDRLIDEATDAALSGQNISNEKAEEMTMKYLEEGMTKADAPVITKELEIKLNKDSKKKQWMIQDDDEFIKSISGNIDELL